MTATEDTTLTGTDPNGSFATTTIDASQLRHLRHEDPDLKILDVRTGAEFETAHIPGSYNVPLETLKEHVRDLAAVDHPVVLVCQSGMRASQAQEKLESAGKSSLYLLEGGMVAWENTGGDVVRGEVEKWALDRQVRLAAGLVVLAGIAISTVVPKAKWIAGGIGAGLTYSAVTDSCGITSVFEKLPYNQSAPCDITGVLDELNSASS